LTPIGPDLPSPSQKSLNISPHGFRFDRIDAKAFFRFRAAQPRRHAPQCPALKTG
jgi:hypothetical protein